jgi:outer membrane protein X
MKRFIERFAIVIALVTIGLGSAKAQEADGKMAAGANVGIAAGDGITSFGVGAKFQYNVTDQIRGEGLFTYYLGDFSFWDLSVNAHYLIGIPSIEKLKVYPLVGLSLMGFGGNGGNADTGGGEWGIDYSDTEDSGAGRNTSFGGNIGAGGQYELIPNICIQAELKYRIGESGTNRFMISAGVAYKF